MSALAIVVAVITAQHYLTGVSRENMALHNIHYLLYILPILMAAIWYGLAGGIAAAVLVSVLYAPVVFGHSGAGMFMSGAQKVLEIITYLAVGLVTGLLAERERREREGYRRAAEELEKAYQKLREQTDLILEKEEQLRRAERLSTLGELAAGVAHEIRNPLASIKGTVEILQDAATPDAKRAEFAQLMLAEVDRLNGFIGKFLELARFRKLQREPVRVNEFVRQVLEIAELRLKRGNIDVRTQFAAGLPELHLDGIQMQHALLNLVLNAIGAMDEGGTLTVTTRLGEENGAPCVLIRISDTGAGIEPAHIAHIFDPFFTTRPEGTGLGLAIVKRIVEAHDGTVTIESDLGRGTCATVALPTMESAT
jgi:signal transduction histidine kinase